MFGNMSLSQVLMTSVGNYDLVSAGCSMNNLFHLLHFASNSSVGGRS